MGSNPQFTHLILRHVERLLGSTKQRYSFCASSARDQKVPIIHSCLGSRGQRHRRTEALDHSSSALLYLVASTCSSIIFSLRCIDQPLVDKVVTSSGLRHLTPSASSFILHKPPTRSRFGRFIHATASGAVQGFPAAAHCYRRVRPRGRSATLGSARCPVKTRSHPIWLTRFRLPFEFFRSSFIPHTAAASPSMVSVLFVQACARVASDCMPHARDAARSRNFSPVRCAASALRSSCSASPRTRPHDPARCVSQRSDCSAR